MANKKTKSTAGDKTPAVDHKANAEAAEAASVDLANETTDEQPAPKKAKVATFEVDGKNYSFSDRCPAKVQVNGTVYTQKELLNDKDAIKFLTVGNHPFIKKA